MSHRSPMLAVKRGVMAVVILRKQRGVPRAQVRRIRACPAQMRWLWPAIKSAIALLVLVGAEVAKETSP